jgi:hypothetical protein
MCIRDRFNNEVRFLKVEAESTKERRVARCEDEPRLTVVTTDSERTYHVDGKPVADQSAEGVVAALNGGAA